MDDDKMSCGQEVGMSSGEALMPRSSGAAAGNFLIESPDLRLEITVEESCSELPASTPPQKKKKKKKIPGEAIGNFSIEAPDLREESFSGLLASQKIEEKLHPGMVPKEEIGNFPRNFLIGNFPIQFPDLREESCCAPGIFKTQADVEESCSELPASYAEADVKVSCCAHGIFKTQSVGDFKTQWVTAPVSSPVSLPVFLPTIYKVPQRIRQANKDAYEAYEPQIVSIGPYHHLKKKEFEKHKERYQQSILFRNAKHVLEHYQTAIAKLENEVRSCYSEHVGLDCNEFVEMMVIDGCFIVELFLRLGEKEKKEKEFADDPIFSTIWMLPLIRYDMLLLQNQIPFFVLEIIYKMASLGSGSLVELALHFFERIIENKIKVSKDLINGHYFHLLHLFHSYLMPTPREKSKKCKLQMFLCSKGSNEAKLPIKNTTIKKKAKCPCFPSRNSTTIKMIPRAAELQLAGVKFKKKKDFGSFLDVKFSSGVLEIPYLCIDDYTNTLLRNLVALEQFCYPGVKTIHFTNYVGFMDCLINTSKDVALLHRNRIIDHLLASDGHVADLFNQLRYGIFNDYEHHNYLSGIYKDVDKYYNTPWNTCLARLRSDYFTNPWAGLSSAAAVLLIGLTILQTIYILFSYYRPGS